jgi:hypothetical protein
VALLAAEQREALRLMLASIADALITTDAAGRNHSQLISRQAGEMPIDESAAPIRAPDGQLHGVVLVLRDIGEGRRA